jgi:hypothetical protein
VKKEPNKYEIRGDVTAIFLYRRNGECYETFIDTEDLEKVKSLNLSWHTWWNKDTQSYLSCNKISRFTSRETKI